MNARLTCGLLCLTLCIAMTFAAGPAGPASTPPARPAAPAGPAGPSKAEIDGIAKELETSAASWIKTDKDDPALMNKIKGLVYDDASIHSLVDVLNAGNRKDPVNLYVTYNLLTPLALAKSELIHKNLAAIDPICRKLIDYHPFRQLSPSELAGLKPPDASASVEDTVRQKEQSQKRQEAKIATDKVIVQHNDLVYRLDKLMLKLRLMADDPAEDLKVLNTAVAAEQQNNALWNDIVDMIRAEVPNLSEKRAKFFYSSFKAWGNKLLLKVAMYRDYSQPKLMTSQQSTYDEKRLYPGILIYQTANQLNGPAKMPALNCPSSQEVDAAQKPVSPTKPTKPHVVLHP